MSPMTPPPKVMIVAGAIGVRADQRVVDAADRLQVACSARRRARGSALRGVSAGEARAVKPPDRRARDDEAPRRARRRRRAAPARRGAVADRHRFDVRCRSGRCGCRRIDEARVIAITSQCICRPDFLIVGSGIAGLRAAIGARGRRATCSSSPRPSPRESNTGYAQGGIAAAVGADDSPALHCADTMRAGDGLCDERPCACSSKKARATCAS